MSGDVALVDSGDSAVSRLVRTATTLFDAPRFRRLTSGDLVDELADALTEDVADDDLLGWR